MSVDNAVTELRIAQDRWESALRAHLLAPPDAGYARRLRNFAEACEQQQTAYAHAAAAGLGWTPVPPSETPEAPPELSPDSGRRGPPELWGRFDSAIEDFGRTLEGISLASISHAFGELGEITRALSRAVAEQDAVAQAAERDTTYPGAREASGGG